ncbi:uncharacterized protein V6R79_022655 [Siganus canaliculatus]
MPPLEYLPVSGHRKWLHQMEDSTQLDTPVPPDDEWLSPDNDWPDFGYIDDIIFSSDSEECVGIFEVYVIPDSEDDEDELGTAEPVLPDSEDDSGGEADVISISSSSEYGVEDHVPPVAPHAPPDLFPPSPVFPGSQPAHREESRDADAEDEDEDVDEDEEVANISAGTLQESHSSLVDLGCASSSCFFVRRRRCREESDEEDWEEEASPKRPRWSDGSN